MTKPVGEMTALDKAIRSAAEEIAARNRESVPGCASDKYEQIIHRHLLSSGQRAEEMEKALEQIKSDAADPDFATLANGHVLKRIYETAREALRKGV